jgi:hypothetical protein
LGWGHPGSDIEEQSNAESASHRNQSLHPSGLRLQLALDEKTELHFSIAIERSGAMVMAMAEIEARRLRQ